MENLNRESQPELAQDFYIGKSANPGIFKTVCPYLLPFISDMKKGEF
jgi:hypothetical protein